VYLQNKEALRIAATDKAVGIVDRLDVKSIESIQTSNCFWITTKTVVVKKASIGNNGMQVGVEIQETHIDLYGDTGSGNRSFPGHGIRKICPDHLKGAFAEL
jgi:hypothetical protein